MTGECVGWRCVGIFGEVDEWREVAELEALGLLGVELGDSVFHAGVDIVIGLSLKDTEPGDGFTVGGDDVEIARRGLQIDEKRIGGIGDGEVGELINDGLLGGGESTEKLPCGGALMNIGGEGVREDLEDGRVWGLIGSELLNGEAFGAFEIFVDGCGL